jgi:phosphoglycolate phosphatase-like HAD superfamily hydrolase
MGVCVGSRKENNPRSQTQPAKKLRMLFEPAWLEAAAALLALCRVLVVEDAVNGIKAAHAAGCFTVGITNSLPRHMLEPHADVVVDSISECEALLNGGILRAVGSQ